MSSDLFSWVRAAHRHLQVGDTVRLNRRLAVIDSIVESEPYGKYLVRWADNGQLVCRDIPWHELETD